MRASPAQLRGAATLPVVRAPCGAGGLLSVPRSRGARHPTGALPCNAADRDGLAVFLCERMHAGMLKGHAFQPLLWGCGGMQRPPTSLNQLPGGRVERDLPGEKYEATGLDGEGHHLLPRQAAFLDNDSGLVRGGHQPGGQQVKDR